MRFEPPRIPAGDSKEDVLRQWSYLYKMTEQLNIAMSALESQGAIDLDTGSEAGQLVQEQLARLREAGESLRLKQDELTQALLQLKQRVDGLPSAADYITKRETLSGWSVTRWKSGRIDAEAKMVAVRSFVASGNLWYTKDPVKMAYPAGLFSRPPLVTATEESSYAMWRYCNKQGTATETPAYRFYRTSAGDNVQIQMSYSVSGKGG